MDTGWCSAVILLAQRAGFNSAPLRFDQLLQKVAVRSRTDGTPRGEIKTCFLRLHQWSAFEGQISSHCIHHTDTEVQRGEVSLYMLPSNWISVCQTLSSTTHKLVQSHAYNDISLEYKFVTYSFSHFPIWQLFINMPLLCFNIWVSLLLSKISELPKNPV